MQRFGEAQEGVVKGESEPLLGGRIGADEEERLVATHAFRRLHKIGGACLNDVAHLSRGHP